MNLPSSHQHTFHESVHPEPKLSAVSFSFWRLRCWSCSIRPNAGDVVMVSGSVMVCHMPVTASAVEVLSGRCLGHYPEKSESYGKTNGSWNCKPVNYLPLYIGHALTSSCLSCYDLFDWRIISNFRKKRCPDVSAKKTKPTQQYICI